MKLPIVIYFKEPKRVWPFNFYFVGKAFLFWIWVCTSKRDPKTGILVRYADWYITEITNHEKIHYRQQVEMLFVFAWFAYLIAGIISRVRFGKWYWYNPFEEEAHDNASDLTYLSKRKPYAWIKYIGKTQKLTKD